MRWSLALFSLAVAGHGLAGQIPFQVENTLASTDDLEKSKILTVEEFVEISRPGVGVANDAGDLVLVPVSKYSIAERKYA